MSHVAGTTPYAWPWNGRVDLDRLVLVVTGWDPHWAAATSPGPEPLANIVLLARHSPRTVIVSHRPPRRSDVTGPSPTLPDLAGTSVEAVGIDGFHGSHLDAELRDLGSTQLLLAGLGLETTVHSTMRRANDMGLECLLVADACAPVDAALVPNAISSVEMSGGIFGAVGTTASVLTALHTASNDKESA